MSSLIMPQKRTAWHCGNPATSEALKRPFLSFIGKEQTTPMCRKHGLPPTRIAAWLNDDNVLPDDIQEQVRRVLGMVP